MDAGCGGAAVVSRARVLGSSRSSARDRQATADSASAAAIGQTRKRDGAGMTSMLRCRPIMRRAKACEHVALLELNVKHTVPEWGNQPVQFALEEDAALLESGWTWIAGPQTQFYLIR